MARKLLTAIGLVLLVTSCTTSLDVRVERIEVSTTSSDSSTAGTDPEEDLTRLIEEAAEEIVAAVHENLPTGTSEAEVWKMMSFAIDEWAQQPGISEAAEQALRDRLLEGMSFPNN